MGRRNDRRHLRERLARGGADVSALLLVLDRSWWAYLLRRADDPGYCSWPTRIWCRIRNHPEGVWFYNAGGLEPDMTCKNCGDDLG